MKTAKYLGIWMDHQDANLIEFTDEPMVTKTISSDFTHGEKEQILKRSENLMHRKEQSEQAAYYRTLGDVIINYNQVVLFGPTDAKTELYDSLKENALFSDIKFELIPTDKMTKNQQHAFVREYFTA
jgi:stalled ribosome rescue protein Dom34